MRHLLLIATVAVFLTRLTSDAAAGVTIDASSFVTTITGDYNLGGNDYLELWRSTAAVPYHEDYASTYTYLTGDVSTSTGTIDHSYNGVTTVLQYDFEQESRRFGSIVTGMEYLYFVPAVDATYTLSGFFQFDSGNYDAEHLSLSAYLFDISDGFHLATALYSGYQKSRHTSNERFELHTQGGNFENYLGPGSSLTGRLAAGRTYSFSFSSATFAFADTHASAVGNITLRIVEGPPVPEPSSLAAFASAIATLAACIRFRRCY